MADNTSDRGPADAARINVHEDYELKYWTQALGVTAAELRDAVSAVGVMVKDVRAHLEKSAR